MYARNNHCWDCGNQFYLQTFIKILNLNYHILFINYYMKIVIIYLTNFSNLWNLENLDKFFVVNLILIVDFCGIISGFRKLAETVKVTLTILLLY